MIVLYLVLATGVYPLHAWTFDSYYKENDILTRTNYDGIGAVKACSSARTYYMKKFNKDGKIFRCVFHT